MTTTQQTIMTNARKLARVGRPKGGGGLGYDPVTDTAGAGNEYLAGRLKKSRPDLAARVAAGEMTIRKAAVEAGFVKRTIAIPVEYPERAAAMILRQGHDFASDLVDILWEALENAEAAMEREGTS